jgi:hypothetical protein
MVIVVINEGLEVSDLDLLLSSIAFEERVKLEPHCHRLAIETYVALCST